MPKPYEPNYDSTQLKKLIETEEHNDILNWIREEKLSLQSRADTDPTNPKKTLIRQILNEAENGDEIIKEILDSYVTKTSVGTKKISPTSYNVKVDFSGIVYENDKGEQESILNDLVQLYLKYKSSPLDKISSLAKKGLDIISCEKEKADNKNKKSPQIILGKKKPIKLHIY